MNYYEMLYLVLLCLFCNFFLSKVCYSSLHAAFYANTDNLKCVITDNYLAHDAKTLTLLSVNNKSVAYADPEEDRGPVPPPPPTEK